MGYPKTTLPLRANCVNWLDEEGINSLNFRRNGPNQRVLKEINSGN
jgi:hypothetical protein